MGNTVGGSVCSTVEISPKVLSRRRDSAVMSASEVFVVVSVACMSLSVEEMSFKALNK